MTDSRAGVHIRAYIHGEDYERVNQFLVDLYEPGAALAGWLQPRWEYMHFHSNVDDVDLSRIGIAESGGEMVAWSTPSTRWPLFTFRLDRGFMMSRIS